METLSELMGFVDGNSPHEEPIMQSFDVFFFVMPNKLLNKQ